MFYKLISSESDPVDMEDAEAGHPWPFTVSATGSAGERRSECLGDYIFSDGEHRGRPVYVHSEARRYTLHRMRLFSSEDGGWAVSAVLGNIDSRLRSTTAAPSPDICLKWEYSDRPGIGSGGPPYKDGDITVTIKK